MEYSKILVNCKALWNVSAWKSTLGCMKEYKKDTGIKTLDLNKTMFILKYTLHTFVKRTFMYKYAN